MADVLLVDDNPVTARILDAALRKAGYRVTTAPPRAADVRTTRSRRFDVVVATCPQSILNQNVAFVGPKTAMAVVVITEASDGATPIRDASFGVFDQSNRWHGLVDAISRALSPPEADRVSSATDAEDGRVAHAAARWAQLVVRVADSSRDTPTIAAWGRFVAASPGAVRNWCHTAGIPARRSLVFARLLRAVTLNRDGRTKLENLLDSVDRRTVSSLVRYAGLATAGFPRSTDEYLRRQTLVADFDVLRELRRALDERQRRHIASANALSLHKLA
jgi:CheY-like chemotaxis protein